MDIFFPHTIRERTTYRESAIKCGFVELLAESTSNVEILATDDRMPILLLAWKTIGNYLTTHPYNENVGIIVSWIGRCTLDLWFGREWIACEVESKKALIEQMMKVYPTAFITLHPYSWPYMFSIYRDPWMVEYLNINFQLMSGPDAMPILEPKDSEFIQQEGIPLLILRMVNMFDFRMVKLVKYMCLRLLLTWQDEHSAASKSLRASPNANEYIDYARHIYLLAICENNGVADLHYTLETIQRIKHCDPMETGPLELGARTIANGLQESNKTLTELLIAFLLKTPKTQFKNIFGDAISKYTSFLTEYQLRKLSFLSSIKLSWPHEEVYSKLVEMFIMHRESSETLIKETPKISEQIFSEVHNLTASKCAYELIKQRPQPEWHTTKITLLLSIISDEINVIQDYKYNDVQSTDELIEKEKEAAIYYRDLAKLFHKTPYLEQEAWLTTFSLHPCREFMDAVIKCGGKNLRAIKKQAQKLKVIEAPETKTKIKEDISNVCKEEHKPVSLDVKAENALGTELDLSNPGTRTTVLKTLESTVTNPDQDTSKIEIKAKPKRQRKKAEKNGPNKIDGAKKIERKIKDEPKDKSSENIFDAENGPGEKNSTQTKRGRPIGALSKNPKPKPPTNPIKKPQAKKPELKPDLAEEIFAAAAGAAENIASQTEETIKYPAFALMNSVTDTEDLMKFTNYDEAYEQYEELNRILLSTKLNHTCHEDLLALLIAPRYKRLTWAVSWKKLKKRCRIILTKDNKKRELVEQSMADANDRLTHLNIDYEKYKDKPQIDYGTIEGGYECFDIDSDDDDLKTEESDIKMPKQKSTVRKRGKKLVDSSNEVVKLEELKVPCIDMKPILKIENLDSSTSNLINISTHLSKPVYLNKPVYFVRNPLASPLSETAISLETGPEIKISSKISTRRSTGEETLTSDSFEEHHWHLTTTQTLSPTPPAVRRISQEQGSISLFRPTSSHFRSVFKTEPTFNMPASIKEQLEQPSMFFKSMTKTEPALESTCKEEEIYNRQTTQNSSLDRSICSLQKITQIYHHSSTSNQVSQSLSGISRFSPKLFEDMPEDLTMPKSSNTELYETNASLQDLPLNLTSRVENDYPVCKIVFRNDVQPMQDIEPLKKPLKRKTKQPPRSLTKINSRKRPAKEDGTTLIKEGPSDKIERSNSQPCSNLKSVRIIRQNKNSKATRINPTAAVVFSSAAASYHRTPYLNTANQEPNILHRLLSKQIGPLPGINNSLQNTTVNDTERVTNTNNEKRSDYVVQLEAIPVPEPTAVPNKSAINSTLEVQTSSISNLLSAGTEMSNDRTNRCIQSAKNKIGSDTLSASNFVSINLSSCNVENHQTLRNEILTSDTLQNLPNALEDSKEERTSSYLTVFNALATDQIKNYATVSENVNTDESSAINTDGISKIISIDGEWSDNDVKNSNLLDQSENLNKVENDCEIEELSQTKPFSDTESNKAICNPLYPTQIASSKEMLYDFRGNTEFEFKVPAAVAKPCFFIKSKRMKSNSYASDWVKNIMFYEKTAKIVTKEKVQSMHYHLNDANVYEMKSKVKPLVIENVTNPLQSLSGDILNDKHIVFNTKLLDPHLKTYKNTKALLKVTDTKKSDTDDFIAENPADRMNIENQQIIEKNENNVFETSTSSMPSDDSMTDSLLEQPTSSPEPQSPSPLASTSQQFVHTPRSFSNSDPEQSGTSPLKRRKRICKPTIPSTKREDNMCKHIETITRASREPVLESVYKSGRLLNIFAAQLMNQAKDTYFNNEYLVEKEKLIAANSASDVSVSCEASILMASPGPSADCVKLIRALKKRTVFKGLDMSSNEVSFTSSLAKEILGTVYKVTLNDNDNHASCSGNHFDASDVLDEFTRSRQDANSPTFYSPTLSVKHLRNGTLADSVGFVDTHSETFTPETSTPKARRKRTSVEKNLTTTSPIQKRTRKRKPIDTKISPECNQLLTNKANVVPPVKKRTRKRKPVDAEISPECNQLSSTEANVLPPEKDLSSEFSAEPNSSHILKQVDTPEKNCSDTTMQLLDAPKSQDVFPQVENSFDDVHELPVMTNSTVLCTTQVTRFDSVDMQPVPIECAAPLENKDVAVEPTTSDLAVHPSTSDVAVQILTNYFAVQSATNDMKIDNSTSNIPVQQETNEAAIQLANKDVAIVQDTSDIANQLETEKDAMQLASSNIVLEPAICDVLKQPAIDDFVIQQANTDIGIQQATSDVAMEPATIIEVMHPASCDVTLEPDNSNVVAKSLNGEVALYPAVKENITDICQTPKDPPEESLEKVNITDESSVFHKQNKSQSMQDSSDEPRGADKLMCINSDSDEPLKFKINRPYIKRDTLQKRIPVKRIKIQRRISANHRTRRYTCDETKHLREETANILSGVMRQTEEEKHSELHSIDYLAGDQTSGDLKQFKEEDSNTLQNNYLEESNTILPKETNKKETSKSNNGHEQADKVPIIKETMQLLPEKIEEKCLLVKVSSEQENQIPVVKKRTSKPRICYAELDSDEDELLKSRLKIPALKINFPASPPVRRKLLKRSIRKRKPLKIRTGKASYGKVEQLLNEEKSNSECIKSNVSSNFNESDDDKPLMPLAKKLSQQTEEKDADADPLISLSHDMDESDDVPLVKKQSKSKSSKKTLPVLLPQMKTKKIQGKNPGRRRQNIFSPRRPSARIQSKLSRRRSSSTNYFFLSDSDEDEVAKPSRRKGTPDRPWSCSTKIKRFKRNEKTKVPVKKKNSNRSRTRYRRVQLKSRSNRNRVPKQRTSKVKMPILTREDSDQTDQDNIYECATMTTPNETDEDVCSDHRPKGRRLKVVKPMRIRCVSRRTILSDVLTESSSRSSSTTVQPIRKHAANSTSMPGFKKRTRPLKRKTIPENVLMATLVNESSSCSSPVMMNRRKRQFAAKSTSKPAVIEEIGKPKTLVRKCVLATNARRTQQLNYEEKEALQSHNCVNIEIRLQRLTTIEATLCRKPCVRLDKNFVQKYYAEKTLEHKEETENEQRDDDEE